FPFADGSWSSSRYARRNGAPKPEVADASCDRRAHERLDSHSHTAFRSATAPLERDDEASRGWVRAPRLRAYTGAMDEETTVTVNDIPEGATIVDVREDDEWEAGHIEGAYHVPLGELPARLDDLPLDDDMYVICRTGGRSNRAVAWLNQNGFAAFNVAGGMRSWNLDNGKPIVSESGEEPWLKYGPWPKRMECARYGPADGPLPHVPPRRPALPAIHWSDRHLEPGAGSCRAFLG